MRHTFISKILAFSIISQSLADNSVFKWKDVETDFLKKFEQKESFKEDDIQQIQDYFSRTAKNSMFQVKIT